jgi:uncharacterized protein (TIGR03089 family)
VHQLSTPEQQFGQLMASEPARPFVTYYDEASGERSELSAKSLANWVAKTHHLLGDELGLGCGDTALAAVPAHWISVPVLLGCLTAGLALSCAGDADVAFVSEATLAAAAGIPEVFAIATASAATGFGGREPQGARDYVAAVRPQADVWAGVQMAAGPSGPALPGLSRGEVVERAAAVGLPPRARVLTTRSWSSPQDWIETLFAALSVGGSLVIVANCTDEDVLARRMSQERATVRI